MKYQYQMGGLFADIIEGVLEGAKKGYDENKEAEKKALQAKQDKAAAQGAAQSAKKEDKGIIDKLTDPIKKAAQQQASSDITKWAVIGIGLWLLLKRR